MKLLVALSISLSSVAFTSLSFADFSSYQFRGKVKAIAVGRNIKVRIVSSDSSDETEVFHVCDVNSVSSKNNLKQSETMSLIRQAMSQGNTVEVNYDSVFDRCLDRIQVNVLDKASKQAGTPL